MKKALNEGLCCMLACFILLTFLAVLFNYIFRCRENFEENLEENENLEQRLPRYWKELYSVDPLLYKRFYKKPTKERKLISHKPGLILVSIASYRDNQCPSTIKNLAKNADRPDLLRFVVCQQNSILEEDCLKWCKSSPSPACKPGIVNIERLNNLEARGPTWARWRIQQEWTGEEYFLQIDAHTRMVPHWDTILKKQLAECPSQKPILTQYPLEFDIVDEKDRGDPKKENWQLEKNRSGLFVDKFGKEDGFTRIQSNYTTDKPSRPFRSDCWAAGFSFSKGDFVLEAGYDPYTPFIFFGEEMDIALRAYTHGWDFFSPRTSVVFHNYKREHRSTFWEKPEQRPLEILSRFRLYVRMGYIDSKDIPEKYKFILQEIDKWSLGCERTIEEWEKQSKVNIRDQTILNK